MFAGFMTRGSIAVALPAFVRKINVSMYGDAYSPQFRMKVVATRRYEFMLEIDPAVGARVRCRERKQQKPLLAPSANAVWTGASGSVTM